MQEQGKYVIEKFTTRKQSHVWLWVRMTAPSHQSCSFPKGSISKKSAICWLCSAYIYIQSQISKNQIKVRRTALNCTLNVSFKSALASCNFKVSIESYVLAFMNDKLMHRRIKYHLHFIGGASYQSLALAIPKTGKAY